MLISTKQGLKQVFKRFLQPVWSPGQAIKSSLGSAQRRQQLCTEATTLHCSVTTLVTQ